MASSGGLPPNQMPPPPLGWTPGGTSEPAQSHHDETIVNSLWERFFGSGQTEREVQYGEKCESTLSFWSFLGSDRLAMRLDTPLLRQRLTQLIRTHQLLVIDPRWGDETVDETKAKLLKAMTSAELVVKKWNCMPEYLALKRCHANPWDPPILKDILAGKASSLNSSSDYFLGECYEVCMRRLQMLIECKMDVCAFNFTSFLVKHVFEDFNNKRPKFVFLHKEWLLNYNKDLAYSILDVHLALLYRRKEDTSRLQHLLKSLPIEAVVTAAEKCRDRQVNQNAQTNWISDLWSPEFNSKAGLAITDFAMCAAARKRLDTSEIKKIVSTWLTMLNLDAADSNLDVEVEKFVSLDEHSTLSYIIGHRLVGKYGRVKRELCLEQIVHGLCCDINKLGVARQNNDDITLKKVEESLSYGLQTLAEVMKDYLTLRRECILTAFSLTPTQPLYKKVVQLAQESGFVSESSSSSSSKKESSSATSTDNSNLAIDWSSDFNSVCQDLVESLAKGFGTAPTKLRANSILYEKKHRNLEGLLSIQGDLVTEAKNYDPVKAPLSSLSSSALGIKKRLADDLLIMINAPRWHLLSWVLDWPQLEEQCQALLRNPDIKKPTKELKYLVIDYTQFDEWSSEEEITATTGIEKGFESWVHLSSDEEDNIVEKGLDPSEKIDFNVIPILPEADGSDEDDEDMYISPEDYLPPTTKRAKINEQPFLAVAEEAMAAKSDLADKSTRRLTNCLLQKNVIVKENDEDVRATLQRVVPGLNDLSFARPKNPVEYEVRVVQVSTTANSSSAAPTTITSTTTSSSSVATSAATPTSMVVVASTSSKPATASLASTPTERKVQYVYKQGGQTVLIDYPMAAEDAKIKGAATAVGSGGNTLVVKQPQTATVMISTPPKILMSTSVDSLANSLISQITTPVNVTSSSSSNGHLEQPAKNQPQQQQLPKFQFAFGRGSNEQQTLELGAQQQNGNRQFHVISSSQGQAGSPGQRCIVQTLSPTKLGYNIVKQGQNIIQRPVGVVVPVVTVEGGGAQAVIANARTVLANQQQQQQQQQQQVTSSADTSSTHADLIRQLNMARAQGLVVLQHWGDKQVLVHKATGRWIMRQGNRLVTVPPQALGITTSPTTTVVVTQQQPLQVVQAAPVSSVNGGNTFVAATKPQASTTVRSMSSSTMEQLAEFDSILESKFKSSPSPTHVPEAISSPKPTTSLPSGPTFVIITPSSGAGSTFTGNTFTTGGGNVVAVSLGSSIANLRRSESTDAIVSQASMQQQNANNTLKINGTTATMKIVSTSAPNSPVKTVKMHTVGGGSVSANASPNAAIATAAGFVKPPPKPQEDPDTLKRIQQILDDYNEQIRNSPDLQNRPAPRRRTNGPATPNAVTTPPPGGQPQPSSNNHFGDLDTGSASVVQISSGPNLLEATQIKEEPGTGSQQKKQPIVRQIMVPPALAASLQASGRQLMVITGPGGKKMIALRPLPTSSTAASTATSPIKTTTIARSVQQQQSQQRLITTTDSTGPVLSTTSMHVHVSTASVSSVSSSSPTMASNATTTCSPSPPSLTSSTDDRPVTPGLGIPMEMTPGQIMEAEISASFMEDDDVPSLHLRGRDSRTTADDDDLGSETLPDNLFTSDQPLSPALTRPPVITEETEVDTDDVAEDEANSVVVINKRKWPSDEAVGVGKRTRTGSSTTTSTLASNVTGMRTRQRNLSSHLKKSGIGITESSRSSIKKS